MAWTAAVVQKDFVNGKYVINVAYDDGVAPFNEVYTLEALKDIDSVIKNRLMILEQNQTADVPLGTYTPPAKTPTPPVVVVVDTLAEAVARLGNLKNLLDLGVITSADAAYQQALSDAQTAYKNQ